MFTAPHSWCECCDCIKCAWLDERLICTNTSIKRRYIHVLTLHLTRIFTALIFASQKAPLYFALTSVPTCRYGGSSAYKTNTTNPITDRRLNYKMNRYNQLSNVALYMGRQMENLPSQTKAIYGGTRGAILLHNKQSPQTRDLPVSRFVIDHVTSTGVYLYENVFRLYKAFTHNKMAYSFTRNTQNCKTQFNIGAASAVGTSFNGMYVNLKALEFSR